MAHYDEETAGRDGESRDHPTSPEYVAQPAANPIGKDGAEHPDREIAAHDLEAELLFGGEIERHPGRPAEPGEEIEEVDERGDQRFARVFARRREDIELLLEPLLEHLRGDALIAWAFLDADADPEHEQRGQDAEEVERAPSPQRH